MDTVSFSEANQCRDLFKNNLFFSFSSSEVSLGPCILLFDRAGKIAPLTYLFLSLFEML